MSDFSVTARVQTTPPRNPAELRARAAALLRTRLEEIWRNARSGRPLLAPPPARNGIES